MGKWISKKLVDVAKHIQSGGTPKSDNPNYYGGDIPFVSIEDMTACGKYLSKTIKTITNEGLKNSAAWQVPENAIMYSIYATLGLPVISKISAATNQAILNIVVDDETTDVEFLYYYLLALRGQIHKFSSQTTQSNLNAKIVKNFDLYLPESKTEQTRIAQILSTADRAIAQTEALIAKYQRIKTGLMQDLLTKGIDEHGRIRNKATHRFVVKNGIEVPEEWEVLELSACSQFLDNFRKPIKEGDRQNMQGDYPYYGASGIIDYINSYIFDEELILLGEDGENILSRKLPLAFIANGKYWVNNHAHVIKPHRDMDIFYLCMQLESFDYAPLNTSSAQPKITKSKVEKILIPKPDKPEQERISLRIKKSDQLINHEKLKLKKLQSLKTGLMQDLLSGKVRVKVKEEINAE